MCVPRGSARASLTLATQGAGGLGTGQWGWGSEGLEVLLVWRGWGSKDKRGLGTPSVAGWQGLSSKALKGH